MSNDEMKFLVDGCVQMYARVVETYISGSIAEFDRIPIILMTKEELSIVEKYGFVFIKRFIPDDPDYDMGHYKVYSMGNTPFRIKIKEP